MIDPTLLLTKEEQEASIERFIELIQFPTVSSLAIESGAYYDCGRWLVQQCQDIEVFDEVYILPESPNHSPVVVAKWIGQQPTLPVLLLNSHYDVVPAPKESWTIPPDPFVGYRYDNKIYGRGTQDMKCVCMQYLEAIRKIHTTMPSWKPYRSIYLTFVPDEEVGGGGMAAFLDSKLYKDEIPGIALALDEGLASTTNKFSVFYGERLPWWVNVTATGPTGHGSRFIDNTAVEQLLLVANKALEFREGQRSLLGLSKHENCAHAVAAKATAAYKDGTVGIASNNDGISRSLGDVTSLNITMLEAGVRVGTTYAYNCVPPKAQCTFDIRISPHTTPSEIGSMLDTWCRECSRPTITEQNDISSNERHQHIPSIVWSYIGHNNDSAQHSTTSIDPISNPWYKLFATTIEDKCQTTVEPQIFPAATDSRFLRALGIRALGFSPMRNTEIMLHENDEYIPEYTFLEGIGVYFYLIQELGTFIEDI
jgi:aminoacylase